jgi:Domain of unknown function (DUF1844)
MPPDGSRKGGEVPLPGGDFHLFVTRLAIQALISIGILENPVTKTKQVNRDSARALMEDLAMLREKTLGNLDEEEAKHLDKVLADLRHHFTRLP